MAINFFLFFCLYTQSISIKFLSFAKKKSYTLMETPLYFFKCFNSRVFSKNSNFSTVSSSALCTTTKRNILSGKARNYTSTKQNVKINISSKTVLYLGSPSQTSINIENGVMCVRTIFLLAKICLICLFGWGQSVIEINWIYVFGSTCM